MALTDRLMRWMDYCMERASEKRRRRLMRDRLERFSSFARDYHREVKRRYEGSR